MTIPALRPLTDLSLARLEWEEFAFYTLPERVQRWVRYYGLRIIRDRVIVDVPVELVGELERAFAEENR